MQAFNLTNVMEDTASMDVGYWSRIVTTNKASRNRSYVVSITRDGGEEVYTVCAHRKPDFNSTYSVHIAGHTASLQEAVELANETATHLRNHDLFVSVREDNAAGVQVLVKR